MTRISFRSSLDCGEAMPASINNKSGTAIIVAVIVVVSVAVGATVGYFVLKKIYSSSTQRYTTMTTADSMDLNVYRSDVYECDDGDATLTQ
jgi:capsular polysaccharide biosynthesis protein